MRRRAQFELLALAFVIVLSSMIGALIAFTIPEPSEIRHHRERNELYHHVLCERQDELAAREGITLRPCPSPPAELIEQREKD